MTQETFKRSACDRCRGQKLRCPRTEEQKGEPCTRCERAGAVCITSDARPPGRPRNPQPERYGRDSKGEPQRNRGRSGSPPADDAPRLSASPFLSYRSAHATFGPYEDDAGMFDANAGDLSWMLGNSSGILDFRVSDDSSAHEPIWTFQADHPASYTQHLPDSNSSGEQYDAMDTQTNSDRNGLPSKVSIMDENGGCPELPLTANDALVVMARLSERITRQISRVKHYAGNLKSLQQRNEVSSKRSNGVADALRCTSDFIDALRTLKTPVPAASTNHSATTAVDSVTSASEGINDDPLAVPAQDDVALPPVPTMSTILLILSSHLQLLHLYDTLFGVVQDIFRKMPEAISQPCPSQSQSEFRVAGMPPVSGPLHIKLLIQVIQHQIDTLEELIGLPCEFRLSGRATTSEGLLSNMNVGPLVSLTMTQVNGENPGTSGTSGKSAIASLRERMTAVQKLVSSLPE
jgi:hypothetical protein